MSKTSTLHVLFVEDSEDDMDLLLEELGREFGDIVHQRVESAQALDSAVAARKWDLVLCDHNLPALNAPTALSIVQRRHADVPFIIVSGSIDEHEGAAAMMAGAADMLSKNNLSRLVPAVKRELQKFSAMADLRQAREQIHLIAHFDQLTGLPNREFLARCARGLMAAAAPGFALMVLNLSRFLLIPRMFGADAGNQTLRLVGERLNRAFGDRYVVASLGGDRYALLVDGSHRDGAVTDVIACINEELARPLKVAAQEIFLGGRIGISIWPDDGPDLDKLLINAEIAMTHVRRESGRNYLFFDPGMNAAEQERLKLEHALQRALKHNEFQLHYQPQYDLETMALVGAEALLRWYPPDRAAVSPADFIPLLEETGLIVQVGEWALRTACKQILQWQQKGLPPVRVAVNLSAVQFHQSDLVHTVRQVLEETGIDQRYLELEITENIAMHNEEMVISSLTALRNLGIQLAIDDFGTGYSSLSYLKRFSINKLKIDRSFVNGITQCEDDASIVRAIISLAKNLRLEVIAEGVETSEQADFLLTCCAKMEVQGFLFSRPLPADAMEALLASSVRTPTVACNAGVVRHNCLLQDDDNGCFKCGMKQAS